MKTTLIIAIALASITATAQTSTKKIKANKAKAAVAAAAPAQAAQAPAVVPAEEAAANKKVAATDVQATPASQGASTVDASAQAAPKKWSAKAQLYSTTDADNTQNIQNLTTFSGSYKVTPKLGLKLGQTFETLTNGRGTAEATRKLTEKNNFRTAHTEFGVSTSLPGFAGSDDLPLSVNMKVMGGESDYTTTRAPEENYNGGYATSYNFVETNLSIPFTLSPKWSVSIDSQWRAIDSKETPNANRFLSIPTITYTINDYVSVYQAAGWIGSFKDSEALRRNYERIYAETGVTITPIKNLSMTFMVDQDKAIYTSPSSGLAVTDYSFYNSTEPESTIDAVAYEAVIAYTF